MQLRDLGERCKLSPIYRPNTLAVTVECNRELTLLTAVGSLNSKRKQYYINALSICESAQFAKCAARFDSG